LFPIIDEGHGERLAGYRVRFNHFALIGLCARCEEG